MEIKMRDSNIKCGSLEETVLSAFEQSSKTCGVAINYDVLDGNKTERLAYCYDRCRGKNDWSHPVQRMNEADLIINQDSRTRHISINGATCNPLNKEGILISSFCSTGPHRDLWVSFSLSEALTGNSTAVTELRKMVAEYEMANGKDAFAEIQRCSNAPLIDFFVQG